MAKILRTWKKVQLNDLPGVAFEFKETIRSPAVTILTGDLGAGKSTFVRAFVGEGTTPSPSYSLINEIGPKIVHADLYRIESADELIHLELEWYAHEKEHLFFEWGNDYIEELYGQLGSEFQYYQLSFTQEADNDFRTIQLSQYLLEELS